MDLKTPTMTLNTHCHQCGAPLSLTLPETTSEGDAQAMAQGVVCEACGIASANGQEKPQKTKKESFTHLQGARNVVSPDSLWK